ncbi:MAG: hypothetical protein K0R54_49 [Clostridiaceae bacterium]|jgi:hypothetical protein|nr:hypothetical protein [Clostridiaceae bacterium]
MSKFKAYHFSYKGMCLGGNIIVTATSELIASKTVKEFLLKQGSNADSIKLEKVSQITDGNVIFNDNGDM